MVFRQERLNGLETRETEWSQNKRGWMVLRQERLNGLETREAEWS